MKKGNWQLKRGKRRETHCTECVQFYFSQVKMPTSCTWKVPFKGRFGAYSGAGRQRIVEPFSTQVMPRGSFVAVSQCKCFNESHRWRCWNFRACRGAPQCVPLLAATPQDPETAAQGLLSEGRILSSQSVHHCHPSCTLSLSSRIKLSYKG